MAAVLAASLIVSALSVYDVGYAKEESLNDPVMAEIYVSPSGSAQGSGERDDPLGSMDQAREKID